MPAIKTNGQHLLSTKISECEVIAMQLRVKQLKRKDAGSGLASIDRQAITELGLSSGEFVKITGRDGQVVARVWPGQSADSGKNIIRIDGQLRQSIGARIDDQVEVEPADVDPATQVTVALPGTLRIRGDLGSYLRDKLTDHAVRQGQQIPLSIGFGLFSDRSGQQVPIQIVDTEPSGTVVIRNSTDIQVVDQSADEVTISPGEGEKPTADRSVGPTVTYENVGGLDDELDQFLEMC